MTFKKEGGRKMSFWEENNAIPVEQAEGDSMMAEMRESLLANLGQTIDAICKGNMQQMAKASRMAAENTILWMVKQICRKTLERHPGETEFVNEQADILVNSFFGQPNVSLKVLQCINEMKSEAVQTKQRMDQEAHRLDMELRQAGVPHTHNVQNLFGSNSVKGDGNMNVGGGTISL